jgi:hypothetical protein
VLRSGAEHSVIEEGKRRGRSTWVKVLSTVYCIGTGQWVGSCLPAQLGFLPLPVTCLAAGQCQRGAEKLMQCVGAAASAAVSQDNAQRSLGCVVACQVCRYEVCTRAGVDLYTGIACAWMQSEVRQLV